MATYTLTTSNKEDRALQWAVNTRNAEVDPDITVEEFLLKRVNRDILKPLVADMEVAQAADVEKAYLTADNATQTQVRTLLGVVP